MKRSNSPVPTSAKKLGMTDVYFKNIPIREDKIRMDILPENMIHLDNHHFIVVRNFHGHTRVHVRKFIMSENENLQPTKDGISLTPKVWTAFVKKLPRFWRPRTVIDAMEIIEKDLCLSSVEVEGTVNLCLQRLFHRQDHSYKFVTERILLDNEQVRRIISSADLVKKLMESSLLKYTLHYYTEKELKSTMCSEAVKNFQDDCELPVGYYETMDSLREFFKNFICARMIELIDCYGCSQGSLSQNDHVCLSISLEVRWIDYFELAFYTLDFVDLAKKFVNANINHTYFRNLILYKDFFYILDVKEFLQSVNVLYLTQNKADELLSSLFV